MSSPGFYIKRFDRPGPVAAAYMNSLARVVGIMGPQGGGKTAATINRIMRKAAMQPPSPVDDIARYRCIVWMRSYRELWAKFIPDWLEWVPQENKQFGIRWTGGKDNPAEQTFMFQAVMPDGTMKVVRAEVWFRAIGEQTPTEAAKGLHATDGCLPEASSATAEMRKALFGRLGRYPSAEHGGAPFRQLMCDWNAADPYNWTTEYFITERPTGLDGDGRPLVEFFRQPGGRDAAAENLSKLPPRYYEDQIEANADDPDWIRRMVDNQIGHMRDGQPVFDAFDEQQHVSDHELAPWRGTELIVAADAGLTPAAVIGQRNLMGEGQILAEITSRRADAETFAEALMVMLDSPRFRDMKKPDVLWVDPASINPTETSTRDSASGELSSWAKIVAEKTKLKVRGSKGGNDTVIRQASVNQMFRRRTAGRAAWKIDRKHCPELVKACARDYKFEKVEIVTGAGTEYKDKPLKNFASHVGNALEYFAASSGEQDLLTGRSERKEKAERARAERARTAARRGPTDPLARYGARA